MHEEHDTLIAFGGNVKVLEKSDGHIKIGGDLVRFSGADDPDLVGDFFTSSTDYGGAKTLGLYYQHGQDPVMKRRRIGEGEIKASDASLWFEAQLQIRDDYEKMVAKLIEEGKLAYSSGAVGHLVDRRSAGKNVWEITSWPIGEASLTPNPAEPRISVSPLKSIKADESLLEATSPEESGKDSTAVATDEATTVKTDRIMSDQNKETKDTNITNGAVNTTGTVQGFTYEDMQKAINEAVEKTQKAFEDSRKVDAEVEVPNVNLKTKRGDNDKNAWESFYRYGDSGGVKHLITGEAQAPSGGSQPLVEIKSAKASNATDMNIGTAADGGDLVPTDHFNQIIARRDESMIANRLQIRRFTGTGTSIDVPTDNEADGEFVSTAEAAAFDLDAPAVSKVTLTLTKYTKKIQVSYELLQDEDSNLMGFLPEWVGRGLAKTHNDLIVTEVETNGSNLLTTASGTALAAGELEDAIYGDDLAPYLDDNGSVGFVMNPSTYGKIIQLTGSERWYADTQQGVRVGPTILGFPVVWSNKAEAYGSVTNKFALFGNWFYVGLYEAPSLQVLRDPFSSAGNGQVNFFYYFRADYGTLQSEAIGYIDHETA